jgi:RNA polymerase sigma-70 factor (ECF subfamily)
MLAQVANLGDQYAWTDFVRFYDPLLQRWCRRFRLDSSTADELCQRIFIELMRKMPTFRYDPGRSFRGWLWFLFRSRALNLVEKRRAELGPLVDSAFLDGPVPEDNEFDEPDERVMALFRELEDFHRNVERRVKPARWQAYLRIVVQGEDIGEVAAGLGISYGAAFAAARYVREMVRAEALKRRNGEAQDS